MKLDSTSDLLQLEKSLSGSQDTAQSKNKCKNEEFFKNSHHLPFQPCVLPSLAKYPHLTLHFFSQARLLTVLLHPSFEF